MKDFDLHLSDYDGYRLRVGVSQSPAGEVAPVVVDALFDAVSNLLELSDARLRAAAADFTAQVMPEAVWRAWRESWSAAGEQGIRLRVRCDDDGSYTLPWELLYDRERHYFLAQDPRSPVVRYLQGPIAQAAEPIQGPLRLLLSGASPTDWRPLAVQAELDGVVAALATAKSSARVEITRLNNLTPDQLDRTLLEVKPHILHFAGHADWDERRAEGCLILDDGRGASFKLADAFLSMLLRNRGVALVVLNACKSAVGGGGWSGLAHSLVLAGVPAVVAMQSPVTDTAAAAFAGTLYAALSNRYSLEQAVTLARQTTARQPVDVAAPGEWLAPALFMRSGSEQFWVHPETRQIVSGADGIPVNQIDIGKIEAVNLSMGNQIIDQRGAEINVGGKTVNTGGGAFIGGNVSVGGDFVGRDKIVYGGRGEPELVKAFTQLSAFIAQHTAAANVQAALQLVTSMRQALEQGNDEQVADCIGDLGNLLVNAAAREDLKAKLSQPSVSARLGPAAKYALRRLG